MSCFPASCRWLNMLKKAFWVPVLSGEFLNIVDDQDVDHLVEVDEIGDFTILVGGLELCLEFVHRDVEDLQFGVPFADLMADGLYDMRFSEPRVPVYI